MRELFSFRTHLPNIESLISFPKSKKWNGYIEERQIIPLFHTYGQSNRRTGILSLRYLFSPLKRCDTCCSWYHVQFTANDALFFKTLLSRSFPVWEYENPSWEIFRPNPFPGWRKNNRITKSLDANEGAARFGGFGRERKAAKKIPGCVGFFESFNEFFPPSFYVIYALKIRIMSKTPKDPSTLTIQSYIPAFPEIQATRNKTQYYNPTHMCGWPDAW